MWQPIDTIPNGDYSAEIDIWDGLRRYTDCFYENGLIAKHYVNEDVAERIVGLLHKCEVKCKVGIYKIIVCRVSDGKIC